MNTNEIITCRASQIVRRRRVRVPSSRDSQLATRHARQGILLLVVLSMLTLFLLIGTAFIVSSDHYRQINKIQAKITEQSNSSIDQGNLLNEVINQLIRDTNNQNSTLRFHSLLRDMYGQDGFLAEIRAASTTWADGVANPTGGQMLQFSFSSVADQFGNSAPLTSLSLISNTYNGLVLTFLDGPARGQSTRITSYIPSSAVGPAILRVMTPRLADGSTITVADFSEFDNSRVLINGRPFNGTGSGYRRTAGEGDAGLDSVESVPLAEDGPFDAPIALTPNSVFTNVDQIFDNYFLTRAQEDDLADGTLTPADRFRIANSIGLGGLGGSDESYDAVDYQNMLLAMLQPNPVETVLPNLTTSDPVGLGNMVIPSNHRPAMLNWWREQLRTATLPLASEPNLLRKVLLRPNWLDHPNFTGSNPDLANATADNDKLRRMIYGPWDVDNDNDGVRDSVWVDFGAPAMENSDGKLVKPLAAILILDMDGRLNINAHGSEDIANPTNFNLSIAGTNNTTDLLAQGQGYGPAEISLGPLMPGNTPVQRWDWYRRFLTGAAALDSLLPNDPRPAANRREFGRRRIGKMGGRDNVPGKNRFDIAAELKMQGVPRWADTALNDGPGSFQRSNYATPPDLLGRYAIGVNDLGQPVYEAIEDARNNPTAPMLNEDTPYEIDLSMGAARGENLDADDGTYSVAELERILRAYDADAGSLPSRIWDLAGEFQPTTAATTPDIQELNLWRTTLTTDSYDLSVPSVVLPDWMRLGPNKLVGPVGMLNDDFEAVMGRPPVGLTFADLLEYQIRIAPHVEDGTVPPLTGALTPFLIRQIAKLLPPDLADGLRLDVNRPLGNGRDDNNNGVVDEPGEWNDVNNNGVYDPTDEQEAPYWTSDKGELNAFTGNNGKFGDERIFLEDRNNDRLQNATDRNLLVGADGVNTLEELVIVHNLRRQMLARDLYVMAMTLVDPPPEPFTDEDKRIRARRLAQWAINVVDFRDPDNCMTAFEYDTNPFDGWNADGSLLGPNNSPNTDIAGADGQIGTGDDTGGVVWGAEGAELVITETMAWHDRRTTDEPAEIEASNITGPGQNAIEEAGMVFDPSEPDRDFDQKFRPRGACFVELYCPLPANPASNADTHAISLNGDDLGIDLAAVDEVTGTSPVWRMSVYQRPKALPANECADWDPDAEDKKQRPNDGIDGAGQEIKADRCVYFARVDQSDPMQLQSLKDMDPSDGVEFFTTLNVPPVRPGRFMVVGSGEPQNGNGVKSVGSDIYGANIGDKDATLGQGNKPRRIELRPNDPITPIKFAEFSSASGQLGDELTYQGPDGEPICNVAVITNALSSLAPTALSRRFTITEPANGYPGDDPINVPPIGPSYLENIPGSPRQEGRYGNAAVPAAYDRPHDDVRADGEQRLQLFGNFDPADPLVVECFSMIYLQRLANPLLPHNKDTNPYRTVDGMSANVSLFNGVIGSPGDPPGETFQTDLQNGTPGGRIQYRNDKAERYLASVQSGYTFSQSPGYLPNVLGFEPPNISLGTAATGFRSPRRNQLPIVNVGALNATPDMTLGRLNQAFVDAATSDGLTPSEPFPWLTWNNRPYAGANELMLVPRSRSSQLLREFIGQANTSNPYSTADVPDDNKKPAYIYQQAVGEFGHLQDMFLPKTPDYGKLKDVTAGLFRLLDYVHVPSPYVGTETWLNPASFGAAAVNDVNDPRYARQPPFNRIVEYRDPGRLNLNTVVSADVWDGGVLHRTRPNNANPWDPFTNNYRLPNPTTGYTGHAGPLFVDVPFPGQPNVNGLVEARRGYPGSTTATPPGTLAPDDTMLLLDNRVPTFFANPFRSSDAGNLVPLRNLARPGSECALLRRRAMNPGLDGQWGMPNNNDDSTNGTDDLGEFDPNNDVEDEKRLCGGTSTEPYNDSNRNAYFGMQPMTRLSSMTTNRSNVYAVWVTVGFFEVEEAPSKQDFLQLNDPMDNLSALQQDALYGKVYPEGYQLGQEAGSETGDLRRVREFAIIDRTVPVAFEPGKNHNVDKAVRLRRRIE